MDLTEKTVDSREVFKGHIIRVRLDTVRLPFDEAVRQCMDGTLTDAKTVAAILKGKILRAQ